MYRAKISGFSHPFLRSCGNVLFKNPTVPETHLLSGCSVSGTESLPWSRPAEQRSQVWPLTPISSFCAMCFRKSIIPQWEDIFREAEVTFIDLDTSLFHQKKYKEHFGNVTNQMAWLLYGCTFKNTPVTMPQGSCWLCWRRSTVVGMAAFGGCSLVARWNFRWFSCWHRRRHCCYHLNFGTSQFNHLKWKFLSLHFYL